MKLLITGSADITEFDFTKYIAKETELIISGGTRGIEIIAEQFANEHAIPKMIIRPNFDLHGKSAKNKSIKLMVELADEVLVIWNGKTKCNVYASDYAAKIGKSSTVVIVRT